jgi:hypothetical protein
LPEGSEDAFVALLRLRVHARVVPDIGAVAAEFFKLDIVPVGAFAVLKDRHQFMISVDKEGVGEAEGANALGDLAELLFAMRAQVTRVGSQR